jgi:hypothetical protein
LPPQARLLEKGLFVAAYFGQVAFVRQFIDATEKKLPDFLAEFIRLRPFDLVASEAYESLFSGLVRVLGQLNMKADMARLFAAIPGLAREAEEAMRESRRLLTPAEVKQARLQMLRLRLPVAAAYFSVGNDDEALVMLDELRERLFDDKLDVRIRASLACGYAGALRAAPADLALPRLEELFAICHEDPSARAPEPKLQFHDFDAKTILTTASHYSLAHLRVVEAVVLSLVGD